MGLTRRRLGGLALLALAYAPLHRLLRTPETGLAGTATRALTEELWQGALWGTLITAAVVAVLTRFVSLDPWRLLASAGRRIGGVRPSIWAASVGSVGFLLSVFAARVLFAGLPTSVDAMVALAHARALAVGHLALPLHGEPAAWMVQNAIATHDGLASVYPPGYLLALAAGLRSGMSWIGAPIAVGALAALSFLTVERVVPGHRLAARLTGLAVALSPFVWLLGGSRLSHPTAAAATAVLAWAVLKARAGGPGWALLSGAAAGALVCTRPWTGLVLAAALPAVVWLSGPDRDSIRRKWLVERGLLVALGGLPWAALLFAWNATLFGSPFRLGYSVAFGPSHGLGLHPDPWGNPYGPLEALAYTGSDMVGLGASLFGSPLPALAVVAAGLLFLPGNRGRAILWAWTLAPVLANGLYWHHGQHMGPRMLYETAPAWVALVVLALADAAGAKTPPVLSRLAGWVVLVSLSGALASLPSTLGALRTPPRVVQASTLPEVPNEPTLLFVHGSWSARIAARLAAAGMRRDSIETALRRNATCAVDGYAKWRASAGRRAPPAVDFEPHAGTPSGLAGSLVSPGNRILVDPAVGLEPACRREAAADRLGTVELEPLLWQAPPLDGQTLVVARDLGPIANARVISRFPAHRPRVAMEGPAGHGLRVVGYAEGMELLWRGATTFTAVGE